MARSSGRGRCRQAAQASRLFSAKSMPCEDYLIRGLDVLHGDVDALELRVVLDCGTAVLAPETRGLVAAEGQFNGRHVVVVDPAGASLELRDDAVRTRQVGGENSGRQSELGLVGAADDFGFLIEGQYAHHR